MMCSSGLFVDRATVPRHCLRTGCLGVFLLLVAFVLPVSAEDTLPDLMPPVEVEIITPEMHRAELRRALASELDSDGIRERRKLSGQEREALHRDLRDAMRNVNADRDSGVEPKQR